jgi:hypothetical protein
MSHYTKLKGDWMGRKKHLPVLKEGEIYQVTYRDNFTLERFEVSGKLNTYNATLTMVGAFFEEDPLYLVFAHLKYTVEEFPDKFDLQFILKREILELKKIE